MMLHLRRDLVGDFLRAMPVDYRNPFLPAQRAGSTKDFSSEGHVGDPTIATAEIGAALFEVFAADVVRLLERVLAWDGKSWNG